MSSKAIIFKNIKLILKQKKISQSVLAENIGMTRNGLNGALNNEDLKLSTLEKIAYSLKVPLRQFFMSEYTTINNDKNILNEKEEDYKNISLPKELEYLKKEIKNKNDLIESLKGQLKLYKKLCDERGLI